MSLLKEYLENGKFVITAEAGPPKGANAGTIREKAKLFRGKAIAVNVTDNQRAVVKMSPVAASCLLLQEGVEPIMQLTCRDRNRLALQSELLGAYALGVRNVLALTGDHITAGDHPQGKPVFDLDSFNLIKTIKKLNDGYDLNDHPLDGRTDYFIGGVINPCSSNMELQLLRLEKKVKAGVHFIQTQAVYDINIYHNFFNEAKKMGIFLLAGILLLRSAKMARFLNAKVPGVKVPDNLIALLEKSKDPVREGIEIAKDLIYSVAEFGDGVHLMSVGQEKELSLLLQEIKNEKPDLFKLTS